MRTCWCSRSSAAAITLTYSDLHRARLEFFQSLLAPFGAQWSGLESRTSAELNEGAAYSVGTAQFDCPDDARPRGGAGRHWLAHRVPDRLESRPQAPAGVRREGRRDRGPGRSGPARRRPPGVAAGWRGATDLRRDAGGGRRRVPHWRPARRRHGCRRCARLPGGRHAAGLRCIAPRPTCGAGGRRDTHASGAARAPAQQRVRPAGRACVVLPSAGASGQRWPGARRRSARARPRRNLQRARRPGSARPTTW